MKTKSILRPALLAIALCLPLAALAQTNISSDTVSYADADQKIADTISKFNYWKFLIAPMTVVLVAAIKKWVKFVPDKVLPWTAPIIGGILDWAASKFGFWTGDAAAGVAMGGLATWFHQAILVQPSEPTGKSNVVASFLLIGALSFGTIGLTTGCIGPAGRTEAAKKFDTYEAVFSVAQQAYKEFKRECYRGKVTAKNESAGDKAWNAFRLAYEQSFRIGMEDVAAPADIAKAKDDFLAIIRSFI